MASSATHGFRVGLPLLIVALGLAADPAKAADALPRVGCQPDILDTDVPGFTKAKLDAKRLPRYPTDALDDYSEGWVLLEFVISADGRVRDLAVVDALGPKDFVTTSVQRVLQWRYEPAMRNGVATDQLFHQVSVLYLIQGLGRGASHRPFVRKYNEARTLIGDGKFDEAIAALQEGFKVRLNLYEEAMGSFVLALAYAKKGDWPHAVHHIRHADIEDGKYLNKEQRALTLALQVELEARDGGFNEALCAFEELKKLDPASAAPGTAPAKTAELLEGAVNNPAPLAIEARLAKHPLFDAPAVWRHRLLRRKFSFADIKGEVKSFRLACLATSHDAPVEAETRWNVPAEGGGCMLRVDGAPDATFKLIEEW